MGPVVGRQRVDRRQEKNSEDDEEWTEAQTNNSRIISSHFLIFICSKVGWVNISPTAVGV